MSSVSAAPSTESSRGDAGPSPCDRAIDVLRAESEAVCGSRERIDAACAELRRLHEHWTDPRVEARLPRLADSLSRRVATVNAPIVALVCEIAGTLTDPWPVLDGLLASHDARVVGPALESLVRLAGARPSLIDERVIDGLATHAEAGSGPFDDRATLETIASLLRTLTSDAQVDDAARLEALFATPSNLRVRRLAARLLDLRSPLPSPALAQRLLGPEAAAWLAPYLAWTRATHLDLVALVSGAPAETVDSLRRAEAVCGAKLLREIVAAVGWPQLNFGLTIRRFVGTGVETSFPLLLTYDEAPLLDDFPGARRVFDRFLVVAQGGVARETASPQDVAIARFRAYNLAHADLLGGFLDIAPLTVDKVRLTVERMDRIVEDFQLLFASYTDECPTLAAVYGGLKESIEHALEAESPAPGRPLSAELTRLVEMFDDPASLDAVRTLHGLKRYLHQRGLKLGMRLAESGRAANRTISLSLATPERVLQTSHAIEYVDFEPEAADDELDGMPYAVRLVAEEFGRQLVHAEQALPKVKIFCYGNEVHYFVAYRNHPAFVRIDYSPPGRGGMIDLAYYGVSKYELSTHPNPSLDAVERFFRRLDFDIEIENTHVHARYDKERAFDLGDLCQKAASLFRLAPYLMDVDWVIGDLALSADARREVASAWADFFARWGVLPHAQFLTDDHCGIRVGMESHPAGEREMRWDGSGPYRDRFSTGSVPGFWDHVREAAESRQLRGVLPFEGERPVAQLAFEAHVLDPLREAVARGEVIAVGDDLGPNAPHLFERRHPAECLVEVLLGDAETIARAARLADVVAMLARNLRFQTTGAINGYDVQFAPLPLPGRTLGLYTLRDASGVFRLALYADGDSLHVRRNDPSGASRASWSFDADTLETILRRTNYTTAWVEPPAENPEATAARIVAMFRRANPAASLPPLPGERVVAGLAASPGRAVGRAFLGLENRHAADVDGAVLICPSMKPEESAFLIRSSGVVSTGGGALSHAGLLALQFGKPALIVSGTWERSGARLSALAYRSVRYDERQHEIGGYQIAERHNLRERDELVKEGDLVVLDADTGLMRVLGQESEALAIHDAMRQLAAASRQLAAATSDTEILAERGRRLRARHQLEKVSGRLADPVLARHSVDELLLGEAGRESSVAPAEKGRLLALLVANPVVGEVARDAVRLVVDKLARLHVADAERATRLIPDSTDAYEILSLRLDVRRLQAVLAETRELVDASGIGVTWNESHDGRELEDLVERRLGTLREKLAARAKDVTDVARLRHLLDQRDRIDLVLGGSATERATVDRLHSAVRDHDAAVQRQTAGRRIVDASAGGIELRSVAGTKAANLAEMARLGEGRFVPPWFVVTDRAFREALESPVVDTKGLPAAGAPSVRAVVDCVLARSDLTNAQKASAIRHAWENARLPTDLENDVRQAYRELSRASVADSADGQDPFVAVRSSASEEDVETATRAGEFDTFLFIRGEDSLLTHLKRAWSGLWTERALHSRAVLGIRGGVGGGVVVQRMISSRASGVLHTVNVAERRLREMVINAGLGLGEGIVSGAVAADLIVVPKEGDLAHGEIRFRYLTSDKRERVVFNSRVGSGTARVETLYHQRLRPSLEYVEICELVRAAARLEEAYGYPLDIEFAIEGTSLYLLQVRPIPTPWAVWRDTMERWPLGRPALASERLEEGQ